MLKTYQTILTTILILGILFFSFLYLSAAGPYWNITPDSVTYVLGAKNLASWQGYKMRLFPPMTSLILSPFLLVFPDNYLILNFLIKIFVLLALITIFALINEELGIFQSLIVILLSLGSVYLFQISTFLLSDIFYMFLSIFAIFMIKVLEEKQIGLIKYNILIGILVLAVCMTRIVGLALALAIVVYDILMKYEKKKSKNLFFSMLIVLIIMLLWQYRSFRQGLSYFDLLFQKEMWVKESGYVLPSDMIRRFFVNLWQFSYIGAELTNGIFGRLTYFGAVLRNFFTIIFFLGLFSSLRKKVKIMDIYVIIYLIVIELYNAMNWGRFLVPVLPFLFYYTIMGLKKIIDALRNIKKPLLLNISYICLGTFIIYYSIYGSKKMWNQVLKEHLSPFGSYPIKYLSNYDEQSLAMWIRNNSSPEDTYICVHRNIMNIISERKGHVFPFSYQQENVMDFLVKMKPKFILANKNHEKVQKFLLPVIKRFPERFILIEDKEKASLYEFKK